MWFKVRELPRKIKIKSAAFCGALFNAEVFDSLNPLQIKGMDLIFDFLEIDAFQVDAAYILVPGSPVVEFQILKVGG